MIWLLILLIILIISPEAIILLFAIAMAIIVGLFELLVEIFGVEHEKDDK
jgi:hypothetical protein